MQAAISNFCAEDGENIAFAFARRAFSLWKTMSNDEKSTDSRALEGDEASFERAGKAPDPREAQRKARAAAKLRENLMRRKTQSRARRAGEADEVSGLPAAKTDESS